MILEPIEAWIATSNCWRGICARRRSARLRPAEYALSLWTIIDSASTGSPASRMSSLTRSDSRVPIGRRVDVDRGPVGQGDVVLDVGGRREQLEVVLALETLAHDVHVQQSEEAAAEAEAERLARLGLPRQRGVVQRQLLERVAQVGVLVGVEREQPAEDHRLDLAVAGERLGRAAGPGRERVADAQLSDVLDARDDIADLSGRQAVDRGHLGAEEPDVVDLRLGAGLHRDDRVAL